MNVKVGIGQDSHRFLEKSHGKKCIVAGLVFQDAPGLDADSDGDVVFHSICNAISSITNVPILGGVAIILCHEQGITDSQVYLEKALESLGSYEISHVALAIEGKYPKFQKRSLDIRENIAKVMAIDVSQVGITFTSGDGLTAAGKGEGLQCFSILTVSC